MKKYILIFLLILNSLTSFSQEIPAAPEDKAVVYIVRTSGMGFAINFNYFDSAAVVGRFNGANYFRYECKPGWHLIWARSENKDYVEADVEAGKIYFIEAIPQMGALKAGVRLEPIDPTDQKKMTKVFKLMNKKPVETYSAEEVKAEEKAMWDVIQRGLEKYKEDKAKGKEFVQLKKDMNYIKP